MAHKVYSEKENSPAAPAGIRTRNLSITNSALLPTSNPTYYMQIEPLPSTQTFKEETVGVCQSLLNNSLEVFETD